MTRPTPCQKCKADLERARARVEELEGTVRETITRDDEELKALQLAQAIIGAHNENVVKHEARVRELEAQERNISKLAVAHFERAMDAEQKLADANALLALAHGLLRAGTVKDKIRAHLAGQPAAPTSDAVLGRMARLVAWNFVTSQPSVMPFDLLKFASLVQSHVNQQPAEPAPSLPVVGSKWRSIAMDPGSVWTVAEANDINIWLTGDGPEDATRICARHVFTKRYEPIPPCPRTYPLDPNTAEDPCEDCGRDERKHEIGPRAGYIRRAADCPNCAPCPCAETD